MPIVAPVGSSSGSKTIVTEDREAKDGPAPIHATLTVYASILSPGKTVTHSFSNKKGYLHFPMVKSGYRGPKVAAPEGAPTLTVTVAGQNDLKLVEGDGVYLDRVQGQEVTIKAGDGDAAAEFVLFDIE